MTDHIMTDIVEQYGAHIRNAARKFAPEGTDPEDMYEEILIGVYRRVKSGKVTLDNKAWMHRTINSRAIEQSRKELLYWERFLLAGKFMYPRPRSISEYEHDGENYEDSEYYAMSNAEPKQDLTSDRIRIAELKKAIRKALPKLDAKIVIEIAFPSSRARTMARRFPTREGPENPRVDVRTWPTVRKWHVALMLGISTGRVKEAMKLAKERIGEILEEEDRKGVRMTDVSTCQLCSRERECKMVKCDTRHLHPKGAKLAGKKGTALLSMCAECAKRRGKKED